MTAFLQRNCDVFVGGTAETRAKFHDHFDHFVLLTAALQVLIERVNRRTNNSYGKTPEQQTEIATTSSQSSRFSVEAHPRTRRTTPGD
jgi:hypothetical protein